MGLNKGFIKELVRVFVFAFLGAFIPAVNGIWVSPDWNVGKAVTVAALFAGFAAGVKAVTDFLTKGVAPAPNTGIFSPSIKN